MSIKLDRALFEVVTLQLKARGVRVKTGTIVDATTIPSASEGDNDARWVKHKGKPAIHGFKAHVGADAEQQFTLAAQDGITPDKGQLLSESLIPKPALSKQRSGSGSGDSQVPSARNVWSSLSRCTPDTSSPPPSGKRYLMNGNGSGNATCWREI